MAYYAINEIKGMHGTEEEIERTMEVRICINYSKKLKRWGER